MVTRTFVIGASLLMITACTNSKANLPFAPTPVPVATVPPSTPTGGTGPSNLVVFREPRTGFSTTDLYDTNGQIFQLTNDNQLIATADGTLIPGVAISGDSGHWGPPTYFVGLISATGPTLCVDWCTLSVRFGSENGRRRAYLTLDYGHSNPGTLALVKIAGQSVFASPSSRFPPGTPTLSGTVMEMTDAGPAPSVHALVSRLVPAGWQSAYTDENGRYRISGLIDGMSDVDIRKSGFQTQSRQLDLSGDGRLDIQLAR